MASDPNDETTFDFNPTRGVHLSAHLFDQEHNRLETIDFTGTKEDQTWIHERIRKEGGKLKIDNALIREGFGSIVFSVHCRSGSFEDVGMGDYA